MTVNARNVTLNDETNIDSVPSAYPAMPLKRRCCLAITSKPAMINIVIDSSAAHHRLTFANSASSTSPININCAAQRTAATTRVRECPAPVNQLDAASRTMSDAARARSNALSRIMSISGLTPSAAWRLQLPARHANDPTGDSCRLRDIVAYPQRTGMVYLKVMDDHRFHPAAVNFVQVRRRFIQQQHLRSIAQQPRERQPLALARLLSNRPQVLLLDEPTANLDEVNCGRVEAVVVDYLEVNHACALWVSHDVAQATRIAGRVICMAGGQLQAPGR